MSKKATVFIEELMGISKTSESKKLSIEERILLYEEPGDMTLYYALIRKANEMAQALNGSPLASLPLEDKDDKTFERIRAIWQDAKSLIVDLNDIKTILSATGDEEKDMSNARKSFIESRAKLR